jgi:hypothetical protein
MEELNLIQPMLVRFLQEKDQIEKQIVKEGTIPKELCKLCAKTGLGLERGKRWVIPLNEQEKKELDKFMKWIRENKIISFKSSFGRITFEATQPFGKKKPDSMKEGRYTYIYHLSEFKNRAFFKTFWTKTLESFNEVDSCPHFNADEGEMIHLHKERQSMFDSFRIDRVDTLLLCCKNCGEEIEKRDCEEGIRKVGFTYQYYCDLQNLILRKILQEEKIPFETGKTDEHFFMFPSKTVFYLREHEILISDTPDEATISKLNPKLLVTFGNKSIMTSLLDLKTNILILTKEGEFYFYDHTKPVEKSLDGIINTIVEKLDLYTQEIRGNEHDRIIKAFEKIGQELGYIPQREYGKRGIRVDCMWYDREGKIKVAIEVETKGGWKKDIISTWELEPELSIIVTFQKTESVPNALMGFTLMKYLPHKLLYMNMESKNAYLFEKQQILKKYSLMKEEKERFTIKEF